MAPHEEHVTSSVSSDGADRDRFLVEYPSKRDDLTKGADTWLEGKRSADGAEGLWRLHDKLYDLTDFMDRHPGGRYWLDALRGTDITEAFESHHLNPSVEKMLPKFYVREARGRKNSPYTFHEDGFYRTLKKKAWPVIAKHGSGATVGMRLMADGFMALFVALLVTAAYHQSYSVAMAAGVVLAWLAGIAHNFFHQANNWRMFFFDLTCLSSADWRITHAISHHLYPNTFYDWEIAALEPFMNFLPDPQKTWLKKYTSVVFFHIILAIGFIIELARRVVSIIMGKRTFRLENLLVLAELVCIVSLSQDLMIGVRLWLTMVCSSSFFFSYVGLIGNHHHPDIYHQYDAVRSHPDWGLCQMDAIRDKVEITGSLFLVSISFGDHTLHHLFPTVDHSKLPLLYPVFLETCKEFDENFKFLKLAYLWPGLYTQIMSSTPNKSQPGYGKKT